MHTLTRRNECHGDEETEKRDFGRHFGKVRFRDLMHLFLGEENCSRITDGGDFFPLSFTFYGLSFFFANSCFSQKQRKCARLTTLSSRLAL